MIAQIPVCTRSNMSETKSALSDCLIAMAEVISDDALLKAMNLDILMHTRSEDARLRLYALTCSEALWQAHGGKLIGMYTSHCISHEGTHRPVQALPRRQQLSLPNAPKMIMTISSGRCTGSRMLWKV